MANPRERLDELRALKAQQTQAGQVVSQQLQPQPVIQQPQINPRQRLEQLRALKQQALTQAPIQQPALQGVTQDVIDTDISGDRALPLDSVQPGQIEQPIQAEPTLGEEIIGGLDVAKIIISSAVAESLGGLAGLATAPFVGLEQATKNLEAVRDHITLDASTELGKRNIGVISDLVKKGVDLANIPISGLMGIGEILAGQGIEQAAKSVERVQEEGPSSVLGQRVFEETGNPALAAIAHTLPTAALALIGVKGLKSTKLANEKLSGNIATAITQAAPDLQTIKNAKKVAYDSLDNFGVKVKTEVFDRFADKLNERLIREGINPTLTPKSMAALKSINEGKGSPKSLTELDTLRKIAKGAANDIDKTDARLGNIIINEIDSGIDTLSSQIGGKFKKARNLAQRAFKSQEIADMIENASHTASGLENGLRIEARKILKNKRRRKGFTKDELNALKSIEQGTTAANVAKFLGKFGISEGQATSMLGASIGVGGGGVIGSSFGGVPGGIIGATVVPALGQIAKRTAQRLTLENTKFADDLVRSGKNAREVTKAYLKHTPIATRNVSDLTDLLFDTNLSPSNIKNLPSSKTTTGKLIADSIHFVNEIKRRTKQVGAVGVITTPEIQREER